MSVDENNWIIPAITIQISFYQTIRINKPAPRRIIIPAPQVVQSALEIIDISPVPERLICPDR